MFHWKSRVCCIPVVGFYWLPVKITVVMSVCYYDVDSTDF